MNQIWGGQLQAGFLAMLLKPQNSKEMFISGFCTTPDTYLMI